MWEVSGPKEAPVYLGGNVLKMQTSYEKQRIKELESLLMIAKQILDLWDHYELAPHPSSCHHFNEFEELRKLLTEVPEEDQ
jgi:hypothetical protein